MHRLEHVRKKVRHVGQRQRGTAHFDLVNCYHADFDFSNSLCRYNRVPAGVGVRNNINNNNSSNDFGTRTAPECRFRTPILLVYGTHSEGHLGKYARAVMEL